MPSVIKAIAKMYTPISIVAIIRLQRRQYSQLYPRSISVLLDGSNDLDSDQRATSFSVSSLNDLAECSLAEKFLHLIFEKSVWLKVREEVCLHLSVRSDSGTTI